MVKIDELKEELGILKFWLGTAVSTLLALAGWVATNYQKKRSGSLYLAQWFVCLFL